MKKPTAISRRIHSCWEHFEQGNHEEALINFFPALDQTAKRRRPKERVGDRIKAFLKDEQGFISALAISAHFASLTIDNYTFPEAIYKFGRNAIAHDGELDPRLSFNNEFGMQIGERWNLPSSYIAALAISVMTAPENSDEFIETNKTIRFYDHTFHYNELWGASNRIKCIVSSKFGRPDLFK